MELVVLVACMHGAAWPSLVVLLVFHCSPKQERISDRPNPWCHNGGEPELRGQTVGTPVKAVSGQTSLRPPSRSFLCFACGNEPNYSRPRTGIRLHALMDLYIRLSQRFSSLYSILLHSSILYIILYLLWDLLVTLSKYIHV
jgi:hypothetical protein